MLADQPSLTAKEMFGGLAFLLAGNMCVGVHAEDLIVRVDPSRTDALLRERWAKPFDLSGARGMKGWLLVAPEGLRSEAELRVWVARGTAFASSLPGKATKKTRAAGRRSRV